MNRGDGKRAIGNGIVKIRGGKPEILLKFALKTLVAKKIFSQIATIFNFYRHYNENMIVINIYSNR
jgi:hypothetical protein